MADTGTHTDELLVSLLKEGDRVAFSEIYNRYWDKLYSIAYIHLKDSFSSEEVLQNVFVSLWNKRETLDIKVLSVYLAAMVRYAVYKVLAREKRRQEVETKASSKMYKAISMDESIDHRAIMELVQKVSNYLPEKCRMVFIHNKMLDQPLEEVAKSMNITLKTAEAHITKALKIVRSKLGDSLGMFIL